MHLGPSGTGSRLSTAPPHFLLVEDDDLLGAACRRLLEGYGAVSLRRTAAEALLVVTSLRLAGLVADVALPDGSGLDVAREARKRTPDLPILIISGHVDHERLDAAHEIGASYLLKPIEGHQLARFAERAVAREHRAATLLKDWIDRYALSAAEAVTLRLAVEGRRREEIAALRGVSAFTVRNQIATMISKIGEKTVAEAVASFYRELAD